MVISSEFRLRQYIDDDYREKHPTLYCQVELKQNMMNSDLVTFELWDEKLSTIAKNDLTSAISIAEVYWQGLDSKLEFPTVILKVD